MQNRGEHCLPGYFSAAYGDEYTSRVRTALLCVPQALVCCVIVFTEGLDKIVNY